MIVHRNLSRIGTAAALLAAVLPVSSAESQMVAPAAARASYADLADLGLAAPVSAHVRVLSAARLKAEESPGLAPGRTRFYVDAEVLSLIRSPSVVSSRVGYLADLPNEGARPAKIRKGTEYLLFAVPVAGRANELRLTGASAQRPFVPEEAVRLRAILKEAETPTAAPKIVGIGKAFHVPGSLPGESETQIFLQTAENRPVSLSILRRPGEAPRWAVSLTEIVDESAQAPQRDTLLWYRLACALPRSLPRQSISDISPEEARAIQSDYGVVLNGLGPCTRSAS